MGGCKNIPKIDQIAIDLNEPIVSPCSTKYNIGMILFRRELWSSMSGFTTSTSLDMGMDEEEICAFCMNSYRTIMIAHDAVAGHFSFGKQTEIMREHMKINGIEYCME